MLLSQRDFKHLQEKIREFNGTVVTLEEFMAQLRQKNLRDEYRQCQARRDSIHRSKPIKNSGYLVHRLFPAVGRPDEGAIVHFLQAPVMHYGDLLFMQSFCSFVICPQILKYCLK